MKPKTYLVCLLVISILSCKAQKIVVEKDYELTSLSDGILVEKFDSTVLDENKYNRNNSVYKVGTIFKYKFEHLTPLNETKYFKINEDRKSWSFVDKNVNDSTVLKSVIIEVVNGNPMAKYIPDYNQTVLKYELKEGIGYSRSGAIENEGNVWIHPPRDKYFEILELNPFPYIKAPYEIGTKWNWNLTIGDHWADKRWKLWEGKIENKYNYEIVSKQFLITNFGEIECFIIDSEAKSSIGETKLTAYFNPKYGFVKLNYLNIDGSKTILELIGHSEKTVGNSP